MKKIDLTGKRFGRLRVNTASSLRKNGEMYWKCLCDCGETVYVRGLSLRIGHTRSCGCLASELTHKRARTHGLSGTRAYESWWAARARCHDKSKFDYRWYGGRGIEMCPRWRKSFLSFYKDMGPRPRGLTLERKDNNKGYEPGNCVWATWEVQRKNKRQRGKAVSLLLLSSTK